MGVPTRAPAILIGNLIPFCAATVFLSGRIYARAVLLKHVSLDDYLLLAGWLAALANCVLATLGTRYGEGRHEIDILPEYVEPALRLNYGTLLCYQASLCLTKLGISVFYVRVFTDRASRFHAYALIAFLLSYTIPLEGLAAFSCVPIRRVWLPATPGFCLNTIPAFWTSFACNLISDFWIIAFAVPRVLALRVQLRQKVALLATLTLGWLVVGAAILRVVRISSVLHSTDTTWRSYDTSIWSAAEVNISIMCAAAPALKPLFKHYAPGLLNSLSCPSIHAVPTLGQRAAWSSDTSRKGNDGFEMSQSITGRELTSDSLEKLAHSADRSSWMGGDDKMLGGGDGCRFGIVKSTQFSVSHWPLSPVPEPEDERITEVVHWPLPGPS